MRPFEVLHRFHRAPAQYRRVGPWHAGHRSRPGHWQPKQPEPCRRMLLPEAPVFPRFLQPPAHRICSGPGCGPLSPVHDHIASILCRSSLRSSFGSIRLSGGQTRRYALSVKNAVMKRQLPTWIHSRKTTAKPSLMPWPPSTNQPGRSHRWP